ncbi:MULTISPECIES: carbohydrate ABC transporter permease [unclassified Streptomyces]|uniref:carbohydrate ABC transporter permease n=1 Tax=unclassified Streptomyces TaxID=2593676 RepID=UPI00224EB797|nr:MULTISPECIES: carbohydrate ABC transporter permease [unclassified Streptomyces]MCX5144494.1 carbohydrate ABC transporter permease [Streptomyces sp. NBC_00338]WRZ68860.1 carbohydrate ABC transporter permease [Streptomyces sp. NBC_01257]WSU62810.1 carbohydrate ABC transporter permease [Streptomyces sp. NBC_01104]
MTTISLGGGTAGTPRRKAAGRTAARLVVGALLLIYGLVSVYPFLWMVSAAFKDQVEVVRGGHLIPENPTFQTLVDTWNTLHFFDFFVNSLLVTLYTVVLTLVVYAAAGYAFAVLRFPGRGLLQKLFVSLLFVPGVTVMLPIVLLENKLGILGSHWGLVLPFVNGGAPLSILLMTGAFMAVPAELRDSARVDGASELRIFTGIYVPLARPALITVALLTAIPTWNEYLLTRVSLNDPSTYTLPLGLQTLSAENVPHYNNLMAGSLIVVIPVIVLFLSLQRYFVNGLVGAVKG